ncbi:hypothetical protein B7P43_G15687 [Cryptotermes secundus]|uniref:Uncharacterized protein n=1 Tax=Cryptotermes secundus TaxID=105785 RepID=A0A2J7QSV1_9NEOP|nr:hypothetical protein B7P43_G15687 [Cryptotermes secundus]
MGLNSNSGMDDKFISSHDTDTMMYLRHAGIIEPQKSGTQLLCNKKESGFSLCRAALSQAQLHRAGCYAALQ